MPALLSRHSSVARSAAIAALLLVCVAVMVAGIVLSVQSALRPPALSTAPVAQDFETVPEDFTDPHTATLTLTTTPGDSLLSPKEGIVTELSCQAGSDITSGTHLLSVDGTPLYALHTEVPLYRSLADGDRGSDVRALQAELSRLGYPLRSDGVVGPATRAAVSRLLHSTEHLSSIEPASFIWMPQTSLRAATCPAALGRRVREGDALATTSAYVTAAQVSSPDPLVAGERIIRLKDGTPLPVNDSGQVTDADALSALTSYLPQTSSTAPGDAAGTADASTQGDAAGSAPAGDNSAAAVPAATRSLSVTWELSTPLAAVSVPPSALYDITPPQACVQTATHEPVAVSLVASALGKSVIVPEDPATGIDALSTVSLQPAGDRPCR